METIIHLYSGLLAIMTNLLILVLIPLGLLFTIRSRFVQIRFFGRMFRILAQAFQHEKGHLSSFQALTLSVAGRVGSGNIGGVALAIALGGPGAVFWFWIVGLVGMATSFFECTLAQLYKQAEPDGSYRGGPAFYIERGLNNKWLAVLFSILLLVTFGFSFSAVQSFMIASSMNETFGISSAATGIFLVAVLGVIVFGGVYRIAEITEFVVPMMALFYFGLALVVIGLNIREVPAVLSLIVEQAFRPDAAITGGLIAVLMAGIKRGLFSNEAGLGSAPNVAAVAFVPHPVNQGVVQAFSVFIDTIVLCTCTAIIILLSGVYTPGESVNGVVLTQLAMAEHVGEWGQVFITFALLLFAFTSILYNFYLGENSLSYIDDNNKILINGFRVFTLALVFWGAVQNLGNVFRFADFTMALLALVNLGALVLLFKIGMRVLDDYDGQLRSGVKKPVFDPEKFTDLRLDRTAWPANKNK